MRFSSISIFKKFAVFLLVLSLVGCKNANQLQPKNQLVKLTSVKLQKIEHGGSIIYSHVATGAKLYEAPPRGKYMTRIGKIKGDSVGSLVNGVSPESKLLYEVPRSVSAVLSPNKKMLAINDHLSPSIIDLKTGDTIFHLDKMNYLAYSPVLWSRDSKKFAYTDKQNRLKINDIKNQKKTTLQIFPPPREEHYLYGFSEYDKYPKGNIFQWLNNDSLIYIRDNRVYAVDSSNRRKLLYKAHAGNSIPNMQISPSGKYLALYEDEDGPTRYDANGYINKRNRHKIHIFLVKGRKLGKIKTFSLNDIYPRLTWSPVEDKILAFSNSLYSRGNFGLDRILILDLNAGVKDITKYNSEDIQHAAAWSPDGRKIAVMKPYGTSSLYIVDVKTNKWSLAHSWPNDGSTNPHQIMWSPDGKQVLFQAFQPDGIHLNVYDTSTKKVKRITKSPGNYGIIDWLLN